MDDFARRDTADRHVFFEEAAARRDLTPTVIEKDFWVCWTLRRLMRFPALQGHVTFKGGTSLSKAHQIIKRFSEDIDLTIRRTAPLLDTVADPLEDGITGKERTRRTKALVAAAREYVATIALPALSRAIEEALGTKDGWNVELDPEDPAQQTILFHYPRTSGHGSKEGIGEGGSGTGYIQPRIKLEYGARGEPEPFDVRSVTPYVAEAFPVEIPKALSDVETLSVERTFWEKATILHALHHSGKLRPGLSRHYYDLLMLDRAGITTQALARSELLAQVVRNKRLMFADAAASYGTAELGTLRIVPSNAIEHDLAADYAAMAEMFMEEPPAFAELLAGLRAIEKTLNDKGASVVRTDGDATPADSR